MWIYIYIYILNIWSFRLLYRVPCAPIKQNSIFSFWLARRWPSRIWLAVTALKQLYDHSPKGSGVCWAAWTHIAPIMAEAVTEAFFNLIRVVISATRKVPGLEFVINYIEKSYQHDPFRVFLELCLFGWMLYYVLKQDDKKNITKLTPQVNIIEDIILK